VSDYVTIDDTGIEVTAAYNGGFIAGSSYRFSRILGAPGTTWGMFADASDGGPSNTLALRNYSTSAHEIYTKMTAENTTQMASFSLLASAMGGYSEAALIADQCKITGQLRLTPVSHSGGNNADIGDAALVYFTSSIPTGIAGGAAGRVIIAFNNTGADATLALDSASSSAANRFFGITAAGISWKNGHPLIFVYNSNSRWGVVGNIA
jgi:hypothetical protein